FPWDEMVVFHPYVSRAQMEDQLDQEWTTSTYLGYYLKQRSPFGDHPLIDDSLNKMVFLKDGTVMLDVTFDRSQVDLTRINETIHIVDAQFAVQGHILERKVN